MVALESSHSVQWLKISQITSPLGPLGKVAILSGILGQTAAPSEWLDTHTVVTQLLITHPITVFKPRRRPEVARGFLSLSAAIAVCSQDELIPVYVSEKSESELIKLAVFDTIYSSLLHPGVTKQKRREAYYALKELFVEMRDDNIDIPAELSISSLRRLLRLSTNQTKRPRVRHSELSRALSPARS